MRGRLVEWVEKASFERLNKLFEISVNECNHQILLTDKNLLAMVRESKLFNLPVLLRLAPKVLVPDEYHMLKDLHLYEVHVRQMQNTLGPARTKGEEALGRDAKASFRHKSPDL